MLRKLAHDHGRSVLEQSVAIELPVGITHRCCLEVEVMVAHNDAPLLCHPPAVDLPCQPVSLLAELCLAANDQLILLLCKCLGLSPQQVPLLHHVMDVQSLSLLLEHHPDLWRNHIPPGVMIASVACMGQLLQQAGLADLVQDGSSHG